jgi:hypothetical protein
MSANGSSSSTTAEIIQKLAGVNIIKGNEENGSSKKLQDPIVVVGGSYAGEDCYPIRVRLSYKPLNSCLTIIPDLSQVHTPQEL